MKIGQEKLVSDLASDYHVASNNSSWFLRQPVIRQGNYGEHVQSLMDEGPRQLEGDDCKVFPVAGSLDISLVDAITKRRSTREFCAKPLAAAKLGQLLGLANGVRNVVGNGTGRLRNAPSAGSLGSCEMYALVLSVEGFDPGIYHYDVRCHGLKLMKSGNFREWASRMVLLQSELCDASVLIFLASNQRKLRSKYGPRAYRLGLLDAGHVSENLYLIACALDLAITATGGFIDEELNSALKLDGIDDCVVLVLAVGAKA